MPSISDRYPVAHLPRQANQAAASSRCTAASIYQADSNYIHIGVHGSYLATYLLRPTPKLVWTFSVPPTANVTSLDVLASSNEKTFAVGMTKEDTHLLQIIQGETSSVQKDVPSPVVESHFVNDSQSVLCVMKDGSASLHSALTLEVLSKVSGNGQVVYHKYLSSNDLQVSNNSQGYVLIVEEADSAYCVRLLAIVQSKLLELDANNLDVKAGSRFLYNSPNQLVVLDSTSASIYTIPSLKKKKVVDLSPVVKTEITSFAACAPNRILISCGEEISLIDLSFEARLAHVKEAGSRIVQSCFVKGSSLSTENTFFLVSDGSYLSHFSLNVGSGKLSDCINKGITSRTQDFKGFPSLIVDNNVESLTSSKTSQDNALSQELQRFIDVVTEARNTKDADRFDSVFMRFMDGESLEQIEAANRDQSDLKTFDSENDRVVDYRVIEQALSLIFTETPSGLTVDEGFLPERALTYLLTHPQFPKRFTNGLLQCLEQVDPRILRQAIVTCPRLSCDELLLQLDKVESEDLFRDIVVRIMEEFSQEKIVEGASRLDQSKHQNFTLDNVINKILGYNFGFELLNSFVDSNGLLLSLHYSSSEKSLNKLLTKIERKLESLCNNAELLTICEQSLSLGAKKKKSPTEEPPHKLTSSHEYLETMLKTTKSTKVVRNTKLELDQKVPLYSREKLVF